MVLLKIICQWFWTLWKVKVLVTRLFPTLCNPMDYSPPSSSVLWIPYARILEWVAIPFSRSSLTWGLNLGLLHCRWILYHLNHQGNPIIAPNAWELLKWFFWEAVNILTLNNCSLPLGFALLKPSRQKQEKTAQGSSFWANSTYVITTVGAITGDEKAPFAS